MLLVYYYLWKLIENKNSTTSYYHVNLEFTKYFRNFKNIKTVILYKLRKQTSFDWLECFTDFREKRLITKYIT